MNIRKLLALVLIPCLASPIAAAAAPLPAADLTSLIAGPCVPGSSYNPACDVDHNGIINLADIQLTAGHWNHAGVYTSGGWELTGNAGTAPGTNFVGTTDNAALELKVNNTRALRLEPTTSGQPNIIGGYYGNYVTSGVVGAVIAGGGEYAGSNGVTDVGGTVSGGAGNRAGNSSGTALDAVGATVGGGANNAAAGSYSTVPGGYNNTAGGYASFAAGHRARALHDGSFVLADSRNFDFGSTTPDTLRARFTNGFRLVVAIDGSGNYTVSCVLNESTVTWACYGNERLMKEAFPADGQAILDKLSQLPVVTWQAGEAGTQHLGPRAEDFHALFGLGDGEAISTVDLDGVALAAIQALYQNGQAQAAENAVLQARVQGLEGQVAELAARLESLEAASLAQ